MLRPPRVVRPQPPAPVGKDHPKQDEERSRDLQEQDSPDPAEWPEKPARALGKPVPYCPGIHAGRPRSGLFRGLAGAWPAHSRHCDRRRSGAAAREALARHASRHAEPNAQYPANGLRFHSVYDGNSGHEWPGFLIAVALNRSRK